MIVQTVHTVRRQVSSHHHVEVRFLLENKGRDSFILDHFSRMVFERTSIIDSSKILYLLSNFGSSKGKNEPEAAYSDHRGP
jgi:hypothetical protein